MGLAQEYKQVLKEKFGRDVAVFDYAADFDKFWSEEPRAIPAPEIVSAASETTENALIIAWDDMPADSRVSDKQLYQHLTPLDWALAFSIKLLSDNKTDEAKFSIHILDFTVKEFEDAHSFKIIATLLDEMPWVKIYAPLKPANARYRRQHKRLTDIIGLNDIIELNIDADIFAQSVSGNQQDCKAALMDIAQLWRASVLQSDDHHDLNNIVGPQIISKMMALGGNNSSGLERAFLKRLEWSSLCPELGKNDQYEAPSFNQQLDIVVIDDQLARGWDQVLGSLVGLQPMEKPLTPNASLALFRSNGSLNLHGATNPSCLLDALGISEISVSQNSVDSVTVKTELYNQRKFDSPVSKIEERPWMLVLDMRLFSGQISLEREWHAMLAKAALKISLLDKSKLAWHGFEKSDKQSKESEKEGAQLKEGEQLEYLANRGELDEAHTDTALSLFPRLCALRWPSVPIIVFSSTRRRELITKLAEYGNIFLSSPKPNVLAGNPDEQVIAFAESWKRELQAAMSLVQVQMKLLALIHQPSPANTSSSSSAHTHIVIALEEAGDFQYNPRSAVGGVFLCASGDDETSAKKAAVDFQEKLRLEGVSFYERTPYYTDADLPGADLKVNDCLKKGSSINRKLDTVYAAHNASVKLAAFRYTILKDNYSTNSLYRDGAYLRGLSNIVELLCYDIFPSLGMSFKRGISVSFWFPTKQTSFREEAQAKLNKTANYQRLIANGKDPKEALRQANVIFNQEVLPLTPPAVEAAKKSAQLFDFRHQNSYRVETIGGYGNAYSSLVRALSNRKEFGDIVSATRSLKARKIAYQIDDQDGKYQKLNNWFCSACKNSFTIVDVNYIVPASRDEPDPTCNKCNKNSTVYADYSVLSHLADAAVSRHDFPNKEIGESSLSPTYCCDVIESNKLDDFLHVSRLFDNKRAVDGFKLAYVHSFFCAGLNESNSFAKAPIEGKLVSQMKAYAPSIKGTTLTELAGIRTRGIIDSTVKQRTFHGDRGQNTETPMLHAAVQHNRVRNEIKNSMAYINGFISAENCKMLVENAFRSKANKEVNIEIIISESGNKHIEFIIPYGNKTLVQRTLNEIDQFKKENWQLNFG
ncbi:MAG: hypothetical protein ABL863_12815 [Nitrosomonas sp.]